MGLLAALALGELAVRVWWAPGPPIQFRGARSEAAIQSDPELIWRLERNLASLADSSWAPGRVSNGQGLREDHEIAIPKPPGELRVLFLGDSCTFGVGLQHDQVYVHRVEEMLAARFPRIRVECINAGVPGYSLLQGSLFLNSEGFDYEPDLVVLAFGWNDSTMRPEGDADRVELARAGAPPAFLAWSHLARVFASALADPPDEAASGKKRPRVGPVEFAQLLETTRTETLARGIELALVVWPGRFNVDGADPLARTPYQIAAMRFARDLELGCLDGVQIVQRLRADHATPEIFLDHVHTTAMANEHFARELAARLEPWVAQWIARQPR